MKGDNDMDNTIGKMIGVVEHALSITNDAGDKCSLSIKIDYRSCSDNDIRQWLTSNRIIAGQRPWRKLTLEEIRELNGQTFNASTIGQTIKSREQQKAELVTTFMNAGVAQQKAEQLANAALDNPEALTIKSE